MAMNYESDHRVLTFPQNGRNVTFLPLNGRDTTLFQANSLQMTLPQSDSPEMTFPLAKGQDLAAPTTSSSEVIDLQYLKFIIWGVLGSSLAILGFLGNTLSSVVLYRRQMRSSTAYYLISLAIYDNGILLGMTGYFCLPALAPYTSVLGDYQSILSRTIVFGYPLSLIAHMGSIYTCVGFTVERFIAVCWPLRAANTCTRSRTTRAIVLIFLWSLVYNIPRFFQYETHDPGRNTDSGSLQAQNCSFSHARCTEIRYLVNATKWPSRFLNVNCVIVNFTDAAQVQSNSSIGFANDSPRGNHEKLNGNPDNQNTNPDNPNGNPDNTNDKSYSSIGNPDIPNCNPTGNIGNRNDNHGNPNKPNSNLGNPNGNQPPAQFAASQGHPHTLVNYKETPFGAGATFKHLYLIYLHLTFMFLLPFTAISVLNVGLVQAVRGSKLVQSPTAAAVTAGGTSSSSARKEHSLATMLAVVTAVFLVCQLPTIIDNILVAVVGEERLQRNRAYVCFWIACTLMVEINAASNFLLYCFFGKKFRTMLLTMLGVQRRRPYQVAYRSTLSRFKPIGTRMYDVEVSIL